MNQLQRLSFSVKAAYAAPAFALAVVGIPIYVYLPKFYTDTLGVDVAVLGMIIMAVRILDAVTDPLMGIISDRTRSPLGRRRPYIAGGSILLAISIYMLFNPPMADPTVWFGIWIFLLFLFWTVAAVPYESLGPEITFDYNQRNALFGLRDGLLLVGTLVAAASPLMIRTIFSISEGTAGEREVFHRISILYAPLVILLSIWCVLKVREIPRTTEIERFSPARSMGYVFRNRPFIILLIAYTISSFGGNLPATLILYYVQYVLGSPHADRFLALYFVTGIVFLPGWIWLARRIEKKAAWLLAMTVNTGAFIGVFFLGYGDADIYGILVFLSGIGFGATVALPSSMEADVIDYDELLSGRRREGAYVGVWSILKKVVAALGVGLALWILGMVGYEPNVEQTMGVRNALRILYSLVPSLCNIIAIIIAFRYPVSMRIHEKIRYAIEKRKQGNEVEDPLRPGVFLDPLS